MAEFVRCNILEIKATRTARAAREKLESSVVEDDIGVDQFVRRISPPISLRYHSPRRRVPEEHLVLAVAAQGVSGRSAHVIEAEVGIRLRAPSCGAKLNSCFRSCLGHVRVRGVDVVVDGARGPLGAVQIYAVGSAVMATEMAAVTRTIRRLRRMSVSSALAALPMRHPSDVVERQAAALYVIGAIELEDALTSGYVAAFAAGPRHEEQGAFASRERRQAGNVQRDPADGASSGPSRVAASVPPLRASSTARVARETINSSPNSFRSYRAATSVTVATTTRSAPRARSSIDTGVGQ